MSRVGKEPIVVPDRVKVNFHPDRLEFEGPKGSLTTPLYPGIKARLEDNRLILTRVDNTKEHRSFHGLCRSLAYNASVGVSEGFSMSLEIIGVGYRAKVEKDKLELNIGYSKPVVYKIPKDVEIIMEKPTLLTVKGIDKQRVGQVSREIKDFRKPDVYKLKGIRFAGEVLHKKERKAGVSGV